MQTKMQYFNQYYFSKEDQHHARLARPTAASVRAATTSLEACFLQNIDESLKLIGKEDKIGILLSGGVDSSLLLAMLSRYKDKEITCFTALTEKDDPDVLPSKQVAHAFNVRWIKCRISRQDLDKQLPPLLKLSHGGLYDTAANLALDRCMSYCKKEGINNLWTGSGLDMMFGGGADPTRFKSLSKDEFHNLFWNFAFDLLINRFYKQTGDELNSLASRYGVKVIMPFENLEAILSARHIPADMFFRYNEDKYPVRLLARRYGVPLHLSRRQKDPLQHSSGIFDLLREYMYDTLPDLVQDTINFRMTKNYFKTNPNTDIQVFLTLLAELNTAT